MHHQVCFLLPMSREVRPRLYPGFFNNTWKMLLETRGEANAEVNALQFSATLATPKSHCSEYAQVSCSDADCWATALHI